MARGGGAVIAGVVATLGLRAGIHALTGLPFTHKGVGLYFFADNATILWGALWYAFEGGWFVPIAAASMLWRRRAFLSLALVLGSAMGFTLFSMTIADFSRTLAFMLPYFFVATRVVAGADPALLSERLKRGCLVSFLCGTCFFHETPEWLQPFPLQLAERGTAALLEWWQHSAYDRE